MFAKYAELNLSKLSRDHQVRKAYHSDRTASGYIGQQQASSGRGMSSSGSRHYINDHHPSYPPPPYMEQNESAAETNYHHHSTQGQQEYSTVNVEYGVSKSLSSSSSSASDSPDMSLTRPGPVRPRHHDTVDGNHCGRSGQYWFIRDCCGIVCAVITYLLIVYAEFVVMFVLLIPGPNYFYSVFNAVVFNFFTFLAVSAHVKTMITDPGAVPKFRDIDIYNKELLEKLGLLREGQIVLKCAKCANIKPERAHHCSICRRCIRKMDHHCPWVNNCVGEKNQKFFVLFTVYICIISCHSLILVALQAFICSGMEWTECTGFSPPTTVIFLMILVFEGLLFFIFTLIMCITQIQSICYDETGIEKLKKEASSRHISKLDSMREVFGSKFSIHWFSPFETPRVLGNVPYWYTV